MTDWEVKEGYDTCIVAEEDDLASPGTEVQLFRFRKGKFAHYHKKKTEFFYFTAGEGKVILDEEEIPLSTGTTLLIKPFQKHTFINESDEIMLEGIMIKTNNDYTDTFTE